ncbi:MAG: hypothetical protein FWD49_01030 [Firmicutes bacterium]|nr:hypothetical protein [Bacillota bacterium]
MAHEQQLTNPKLFNATWTERDEAVFLDLLDRKIDELKFEMKNCESPYVRRRLKEKRIEYIVIREKVQAGRYDSAILAAEMASYQIAKSNPQAIREGGTRKYVESYEEINFNFDSYFRKNRYYGSAMPVVTLILVLLFTFLMFFSLFVPTMASVTLEESLFGTFYEIDETAPRLSFTAVGYYRLDGVTDIRVPNDGHWPQHVVYREGIEEDDILLFGEKFVNAQGVEPSDVTLYGDLGIEAIYISTKDILRAFFYTPAMRSMSIGFVERLLEDEGSTHSWYWRAFVMHREDEMGFKYDDQGNLDWLAVIHYFATYGMIYLFIIVFVLLMIQIISLFVRMFTYSTRKFHFLPFLIIICSVLLFLCPIFAKLHSLDSQAVSESFGAYFSMSWEAFMESDGVFSANILALLSLPIMALVMFMPLFFRNKRIKQVTYVPKGNRPHTYPGQNFPTASGHVPQAVMNPAMQPPRPRPPVVRAMPPQP